MLHHKNVVITGGSSGIGKAMAILFAAHGANIMILGTSEEKGKNAVEAIKQAAMSPKQCIEYRVCDVSNFISVENLFLQDIVKQFPIIDVLVNNAGITRDGFLIKMKEQDWDDVIAVNLKSIFNTTRVVVRAMMREKKGKIINISSIVGLVGNAGQTNYAAAKSGMIGFSKALAQEVARKNICVNCIAPGYIETAMTEVLSEDVQSALLQKIPMQRMGIPLDVAKVALFLASDLSDYVTGQVITVDGGMVL
ncbi:MAG: 3-oxoacyl-[acyl-carrier-protein] reductase [Parachlamydiales bacterium]|nr:3-oxoacyl-[acyl-carrier-protein] reductase [Parachlamydiales bacterium]